VTRKHRVDDINRLRRAFDGFTCLRDRCFLRGRDWISAERTDVEDVTSPGLPIKGVAILDLKLE
jgi:hypothetical protein